MKGYVFRLLNKYAYCYLFVYYVLIVIGFFILFKKSIVVDVIICVMMPYVSSIISFLFVSMIILPHVVLNDLWSSFIISILLPYIALYSWLLSVLLIIARGGIYLYGHVR